MTLERALVIAAFWSALPLVPEASPARAETLRTADDGIALSNSYAGNAWRQQMLKIWDLTSKDAIRRGVIARTKVMNADNSSPQQASQIGDLTLQGWQAIVIDAASTTALNGSIQQACNAHIVVVVFDSLTTAPCAYKVAYDYMELGRTEAAYIAKRLGGKGAVLEVRGTPGSSVDNDVHEGVVEEFAKYPGIEVVASVRGNWTQSIAQKEVAGILPTLPRIDAAVTQAGAGYGTYEAFNAAGLPTPLMIIGNTEDELRLWKQLASAPGGYETISIASSPSVSAVAFWVAQQVLAGASVPKTVNVPLQMITSDNLDAWLKVAPPGGVATPVYSQDWTEKLIAANIAHSAPPLSPIPDSMP